MSSGSYGDLVDQRPCPANPILLMHRAKATQCISVALRHCVRIRAQSRASGRMLSLSRFAGPATEALELRRRVGVIAVACGKRDRLVNRRTTNLQSFAGCLERFSKERVVVDRHQPGGTASISVSLPGCADI